MSRASKIINVLEQEQTAVAKAAVAVLEKKLKRELSEKEKAELIKKFVSEVALVKGKEAREQFAIDFVENVLAEQDDDMKDDDEEDDDDKKNKKGKDLPNRFKKTEQDDMEDEEDDDDDDDMEDDDEKKKAEAAARRTQKRENIFKRLGYTGDQVNEG